MPYISEERRDALEPWDIRPYTIGELNFVITRLCLNYIDSDPGYADYNEIVGALECAKLEFVRRALSPYEDQAIKRNGDVY